MRKLFHPLLRCSPTKMCPEKCSLLKVEHAERSKGLFSLYLVLENRLLGETLSSLVLMRDSPSMNVFYALVRHDGLWIHYEITVHTRFVFPIPINPFSPCKMIVCVKRWRAHHFPGLCFPVNYFINEIYNLFPCNIASSKQAGSWENTRVVLADAYSCSPN